MAEILNGLIERVTHHDPENGFAVLKVKAKGLQDLVTVVGSATYFNPGTPSGCTAGRCSEDRHTTPAGQPAAKSARQADHRCTRRPDAARQYQRTACLSGELAALQWVAISSIVRPRL